MDRRDFIRSIGLGGLALTLPQPLKILAAKASDLTVPPLHVGYVQIPGGISLAEMGVEVDGSLDPEIYYPFMKAWRIHINSRPLRGGSHLTLFEGCPATALYRTIGEPSYFQDVSGTVVFRSLHAIYNVPEEHCIEMWIVPTEKLTVPLPKLSMIFKAVPFARPRMKEFVAKIPIKTVRLERTRAIELGFVTPADPYETF